VNDGVYALHCAVYILFMHKVARKPFHRLAELELPVRSNPLAFEDAQCMPIAKQSIRNCRTDEPATTVDSDSQENVLLRSNL
jgi:hypothetical protein